MAPRRNGALKLLEQNIAYLKFDMFFDPDVCAPTATAAMNFVANADALIIDLRENQGGVPGMVTLISTYLFAGVTHLGDVRDRNGVIREHWTLPYVNGRRLASRPVFVLTSNRTASGAEAFCYTLQYLKRATIVGETTAGAAHIASSYRIDEHFTVVVAVAEAVSPISKTNWEGVGVEPDVRVAAADALSTARKLAAESSYRIRLLNAGAISM